MPTINYILKDGTTRSLDARPGASVMEIAIRSNIRGIDAECGGSCACATCHVYVDDCYLALIPSADAMEADLLEGVAAERQANSRLSCQIVVTDELDGIVVRIPERQSW